MMFGRKKLRQRAEVDGQLLELIYDVHDQMMRERKLAADATDGEERRQKARVALQEGLYDFLHRQAKRRRIDPAQVESFSVQRNLAQINK